MENTKLENWNGFEIRFVSVKDEWHAIAMDVANALDYSDANKMVKRISKKYVSSTKVKLPDLQNVGRTSSTNRQNVGLEAYEAFRMLDKQKQREVMDIIKYRKELAPCRN